MEGPDDVCLWRRCFVRRADGTGFDVSQWGPSGLVGACGPASRYEANALFLDGWMRGRERAEPAETCPQESRRGVKRLVRIVWVNHSAPRAGCVEPAGTAPWPEAFAADWPASAPVSAVRTILDVHDRVAHMNAMLERLRNLPPDARERFDAVFWETAHRADLQSVDWSQPELDFIARFDAAVCIRRDDALSLRQRLEQQQQQSKTVLWLPFWPAPSRLLSLSAASPPPDDEGGGGGLFLPARPFLVALSAEHPISLNGVAYWGQAVSPALDRLGADPDEAQLVVFGTACHKLWRLRDSLAKKRVILAGTVDHPADAFAAAGARGVVVPAIIPSGVKTQIATAAAWAGDLPVLALASVTASSPLEAGLFPWENEPALGAALRSVRAHPQDGVPLRTPRDLAAAALRCVRRAGAGIVDRSVRLDALGRPVPTFTASRFAATEQAGAAEALSSALLPLQ